MTPAAWGALLGATLAAGLLLVAARVAAVRRPRLETRVLPYVRDLPRLTAARTTFAGSLKQSNDADVWQWRSTNARSVMARWRPRWGGAERASAPAAR